MRKLYPMVFATVVLSSLIPLWPQSARPNKPVSSASARARDSEMISGTLVDADCRSHDANDKCDVAEDTRTFGFKTEEGKYYKLDSEGNTKVQAALKNSMHKTGEIRASLSGTVDGDVFKVESVKIP